MTSLAVLGKTLLAFQMRCYPVPPSQCCGIDTRLCGDENALTTVTLPPGTRRKLIMRTASERYRLTLPAGIIIVQIYDPGTGKSALLIPAPQELEVHNG